MEPIVTILMPAYNCASYIGDSISAIINQSFKSFQFLIINDGSTDSTGEIITSFSDPRIQLYENKENLGLVKTLNRGLSTARGKYILRTDADDLAMPDMVSNLVSFMEQNNDYILCGGNMKVLGSGRIIRYPMNDKNLKLFTLNNCPFSHSTVIFRRKSIEDLKLSYSDLFPDAEDYALWSEMLPHGKFHNLNEITLFYRESSSQITANNNYSSNNRLARRLIFCAQAKRYFGFNEESANLYATLILNDKVHTLEQLERIGSLILVAENANSISKLFDRKGLKKLLFIKWHWLCFESYFLGRQVFKVYFKYILKSGNFHRIKSILRHLIKRNYLAKYNSDIT